MGKKYNKAAKLADIIKNSKGSVMVESMVMVLIVVFLIVSAIGVFDIIIKYQNVNYIAKSITRSIERDGQYGIGQIELLQRLNNNLNMDAEMSISDVTYFNSSQKTIQLRDHFTITIDYMYRLKLLTPLFGAEPVTLDIPLRVNITGISEMYWKD